MKISNRTKSIDSSGIRKVFDLAAKLENPINLSIGIPDFDAPDLAKQSAIEAINSRKNSYTQTQGLETLRNSLKAKLNLSEDLDLFLSSGVSGGLMLSFMALLDPEDEILIPDPFFCIYRDLAKLINAEPVYYDCYPDFSLKIENIESRISKKTKAIVINSPSNPCGYAISKKELADVVELAKKHNIWIIYDEIYSEFVYDSEHVSCLDNNGKLCYENIIVLNGFSKSHGVPGWRLGYVYAPKEVVLEMLKIQQYTFVCAPSVLQHGILEALEFDFSSIKESYQKRRDFICNELKDSYNFVKSSGAFYLFPEAPGGNASSFVKKCIDRNLLVVPGNVFSTKDTHFRISYSASMEMLERGVEVLKGIC